MNRLDTPSKRHKPMWPIAAALAVWLAGCAPDSTGTDAQQAEKPETAPSSDAAQSDAGESSETAEPTGGLAESDASETGAAEPAAEPETPAEAGIAFLAANGQREGVVTTASGLQYEILVSGDGTTPGPTDTVTTHYHGTFVDGRIFDSSVQRGTPASFPVNGVIKGWTEALQMMKIGDKWRIYCPPDLAYGERGRPGIPPSSTLIFEVELLDAQTSG